MSKKLLTISIVAAIVVSVIIFRLDVLIFNPLMKAPIDQVPSPTWWQGLLASIYGGFTEEIMLRLFGMTLIVWFLAWITHDEKANSHTLYYYVALSLQAI